MSEDFMLDNANLASNVSGVLVIDKPTGMTSHDVVQIVRNGTHIRRAGHTGTLDPRASGVLVVLVGPAVRLSEFISASEKRYQAVLRLGLTTDTYDMDGRVLTSSPVNISYEELEETLKTFIGEVDQIPPAYSAIKINGEKAYERARRGEEVEMEPRKVRVDSIELLDWESPEAIIDIQCSSGTYVRSLIHDLGEKLGCGATLVGLRRTKNGRFSLRDAVSLRRLQEAFVNGDWYTVELTLDQVDQVRHGHRVPAVEDVPTDTIARAVSEEGELVALVEYDPEAHEWQPRKVFFQ